VDTIYQEKDPSVDGEWILNIHLLLPVHENWIWTIATSELVISAMEKMLGPGVQLYASQLHKKGPLDGHSVPWHQDGNEHVRTLWIPLDDIDRCDMPMLNIVNS
jgi:hypothetical protein